MSGETGLITQEKLAAGPPGGEAGDTTGWRPSAIASDIATLGTGTMLAALFNVALVFVVPKLTSVEDYGYWRLFGLYAGYVGFLHFGFADGALLRWAGHPMADFHREIAPALKYLFWQHLLVLAPVCVLASILLRGPLRFVVIALAIYALIYNLAAVLQYGLQSAKVFRPVAMTTVAMPALFLGFAVLWRYHWRSDYKEITIFYEASWLVVLLFLLAWTKPWGDGEGELPMRGLARACVLSGWPIVLANTGVMLVMFADRLAVSWGATIQNFAQYSLAASAMAVPITVIQAGNNVFFSHLAGVTSEGRKRIYGITSRTLLVAWALLLPHYFALDLFVRDFLPKYAQSLAYARILLLGIPFLAAIQILQTSYAYLGGAQKRFMVWTGIVLALDLGVTSFAAFHSSLRMVAALQVVVLGAWWLFNEWVLRKLTGETSAGWMTFLGIYALASASYWMATSWQTHGVGVSILTYYAGLGIVLAVTCQRELRVWSSLTIDQAGLDEI